MWNWPWQAVACRRRPPLAAVPSNSTRKPSPSVTRAVIRVGEPRGPTDRLLGTARDDVPTVRLRRPIHEANVSVGLGLLNRLASKSSRPRGRQPYAPNATVPRACPSTKPNARRIRSGVLPREPSLVSLILRVQPRTHAMSPYQRSGEDGPGIMAVTSLSIASACNRPSKSLRRTQAFFWPR